MLLNCSNLAAGRSSAAASASALEVAWPHAATCPRHGPRMHAMPQPFLQPRRSICKTQRQPRVAYAALTPAPVPDGWPVLALLFTCGAVAQRLEPSTRLGQVLGAPMLSLCCGLALAALGVLPSSCATFDAVWRYLMPLAAALMMLENDVSRWGMWEAGALGGCARAAPLQRMFLPASGGYLLCCGAAAHVSRQMLVSCRGHFYACIAGHIMQRGALRGRQVGTCWAAPHALGIQLCVAQAAGA